MKVCPEIARASARHYVFMQQVRISPVILGVYFFSATLGLVPRTAFAGWEDPSAGLPPIGIVSAKEIGTDADKSFVRQDKLGRIFVGSTALLVFDGQSWRAHPKPGNHPLTFLAPDKDGLLWTGTKDDLGYFKEEALGEFKFHSLLEHLPATARASLDIVWGCAPLGHTTYFICQNQLLRWDGHSFVVSPFPTQRRLTNLELGDEYWFQHLETGLYRLGDAGPELKFTADQLPPLLIIALFRDDVGIVTVSNDGFRRAGEKAPFSASDLNAYLKENRVSSFGELPNGNVVIGTLYGGVVLANRAGRMLRVWADASSGLPGRTVLNLSTNAAGEVIAVSPTDFFHFPATGDVTVFNPSNGLRGHVVNNFTWWRSTLYAATDDGVYQQNARLPAASFQPAPTLTRRYSQMQPQGRGLLLTRFGGLDWFDGDTAHLIHDLPANSTYQLEPIRSQPNSYYVSEVRGIARLTESSDGKFTRERFLELPDTAQSLHEDAAGRLWIGTIAQGAFIFDPASHGLSRVNDPTTSQPIEGPVQITGNEFRTLLFITGRVLEAAPTGTTLRALDGLPALNPSVIQAVPGSDSVLVGYQRPNVISGPLHGAGIISFGADRTPSWRELELPDLNAIGSIRTAIFSEENAHPVLWLGGMEGILRLDYNRIPTLKAPPAPVIGLEGPQGAAGNQAALKFPFRNHVIRFKVFTGDYSRGKNLLFQVRLGGDDGAWSEPSPLRTFEYTNLSDGEYRFEVRTVNTAGQISPPSGISFHILPPWYRSRGAFAGYAVFLVLAVFGFIRIRERRIRARNQELEGLVSVRTAELVKANAAKDEFLAGISHEIRNPMNGVIGIAENFRTDTLDAENRRKFSLLRQCASHLSSLLEDILDFSKVQAGAIELDPKPFDLPELVESVAGITRADSEKYGIPVEVAVSPAVPRMLSGDARRIRQILINFVSNALKFSGRGQVSITVWCKEAGPDRTEVIFAVSDEGPGISPDEQTRLFTRFERGAAAQKGRVPGTGLGLALCKGLAEKMGGKIWLESELGRGSCFYFSAPFPVIEPVGETAAAPAPVAAPGRRALVVDDQEYNRIVLADLLQSMGFQVHSAQEGQAALDAAAHQAFDVVFLDFNLPGLSGVDVARGIRSMPGPTAHALILATTAFTTPEKRAQCLDAGMDAFLGKPVTRERLTKALAALNPASTPARPPAPAVPPAPVAPAAKKPDGPADPLGNLRLLARRKGVPFAQELGAYFADLDGEFAQLNAALAAENADEAGRFAHMLCGRCSFIYARELEQAQRQVEAAVADLHWAEARRHSGEFAGLLADLRVRLASSDPTAPPA